MTDQNPSEQHDSAACDRNRDALRTYCSQLLQQWESIRTGHEGLFGQLNQVLGGLNNPVHAATIESLGICGQLGWDIEERLLQANEAVAAIQCRERQES